MRSLNKISVFVGATVSIGFSLAVALSAYGQSGGPGRDSGVVKSIDDGILEIRSGSHTTQYTETDNTKWLDQNGRRIEAGDTVGKKVEIRFRWITGGSEALSVQITSGGSRSVAAEDSGERSSRPRSSDSGQIWGTVKSIDDMLLDLRDSNGKSQTLRQREETLWLNKRGKRIEPGDTVGKKVSVTFQTTGDGREALTVQLQ